MSFNDAGGAEHSPQIFERVLIAERVRFPPLGCRRGSRRRDHFAKGIVWHGRAPLDTYNQVMLPDRMAQWRAASLQSFWFANNLNELLWLLQMLGREDVALYQYEQLLNADYANFAAGRPTPALDDLLTPMIWRAYTWVLASYELVRTVSQKLQSTAPQSEIAVHARSLKDEFNRLRVPFAKFEPASKYKQTDYNFPVGCIQPSRGLCWMVADGVAISRMELSDRLLSFLAALKRAG